MKDQKFLFPKISNIFILICFFLPFILIKCNNSELADLKGIQLVTGYSKEARYQNTNIPPNFFVILAFIFILVSIALSFIKIIKKANKILISNCISLFSLIILPLYYAVKFSESKISFTLRYGYYLIVLLLLSNAIYILVEKRKKKSQVVNIQERPPPSPNKSFNKNVDRKICQNCGYGLNHPQNLYCSNCGFQLKFQTICNNCGKEFTNHDFSFCSNCGQELNQNT